MNKTKHYKLLLVPCDNIEPLKLVHPDAIYQMKLSFTHNVSDGSNFNPNFLDPTLAVVKTHMSGVIIDDFSEDKVDEFLKGLGL